MRFGYAAWMRDALCAGAPNPSLWFPLPAESHAPAKQICADCPVSEPCLRYALEHRIEHGIWGGCSERERVRMLRRKRAA